MWSATSQGPHVARHHTERQVRFSFSGETHKCLRPQNAISGRNHLHHNNLSSPRFCQEYREDRPVPWYNLAHRRRRTWNRRLVHALVLSKPIPPQYRDDVGGQLLSFSRAVKAVKDKARSRARQSSPIVCSDCTAIVLTYWYLLPIHASQASWAKTPPRSTSYPS
jgi:hypothetical protein